MSIYDYNQYKGIANYQHSEVPATGILVVNLGTPDAPTKKALYPYLKQFLADPRVIEASPWAWKLILNLFILPFRPKKSAKLYEAIWTEEGSPLLLHTKAQAEKLEAHLKNRVNSPVVVEFAMRIGNPSLEVGLDALAKRGARRLLVLPMFAHYSGTTTASVFDGVVDELKRWRWIPEFRMIMKFHDRPKYIKALAASVREAWAEKGQPQKLVMSFHGIPKRYFLNGDPYFCECQKTGRLLAEELGLTQDEYIITFQSLFGKEEWLRPYTDETLEELPKSGVESVHVICPGFTSDCLETLEEIEGENREVFMHAGGKEFEYIPCLNSRDDFIEMLGDLCLEHMQGWVESDWDASQAKSQAEATDQRYRAMNG